MFACQKCIWVINSQISVLCPDSIQPFIVEVDDDDDQGKHGRQHQQHGRQKRVRKEFRGNDYFFIPWMDKLRAKLSNYVQSNFVRTLSAQQPGHGTKGSKIMW